MTDESRIILKLVETQRSLLQELASAYRRELLLMDQIVAAPAEVEAETARRIPGRGRAWMTRAKALSKSAVRHPQATARRVLGKVRRQFGA